MRIIFFVVLSQANTYLRNWLLAVLGSPTMQTFISPRREVPSPVVFGTPPKSISKTPRFTSSLPEIKTQGIFQHEFKQFHRTLQRHVYQPKSKGSWSKAKTIWFLPLTLVLVLWMQSHLITVLIPSPETDADAHQSKSLSLSVSPASHTSFSVTVLKHLSPQISCVHCSLALFVTSFQLQVTQLYQVSGNGRDSPLLYKE